MSIIAVDAVASKRALGSFAEVASQTHGAVAPPQDNDPDFSMLTACCAPAHWHPAEHIVASIPYAL